MLNAKALIGTHDIVMLTFDTLRYDVARDACSNGRTPNLKRLLPGGCWQPRHSPGNFTFAAHQSFFAGFLPTPITPGPHRRLFAAEFPGSETTSDETFVFPQATLPEGLAAKGYRTVCVGGVGFFNKLTALGRVLPSLFHESFWDESLGVTCRESTENQFTIANRCAEGLPRDQRLFLFINLSAMHQPNCMYLAGHDRDSCETQAAALAHVDRCLPDLLRPLQSRGPLLCIFTSDHGTAYGEDGYTGHRLSHPTVWNVPYAEFLMEQQPVINTDGCNQEN